MVSLNKHLNNFYLNRFCIIFSLLIISCDNKSFVSDEILNSYEYSIVSSTDFNFSTYQISPSIGDDEKISVGNNSYFKNLTTFIEFNDYNEYINFNMKIDSAVIKIKFLDNQNIDFLKSHELSLGFIEKPNEYNELTTNYDNISWLNDEYLTISSQVESDSNGLYNLVFNLDSNFIEMLSDSTFNPLFILEELYDENEILNLHSSNSITNKPFLSLFTSSENDTLFDSIFVINASSDVTIFEYPKLNEQFLDSNLNYLSLGAGLNTIIKPLLKNVELPNTANIIKANLNIKIDTLITSDSLNLNFQAVTFEDSAINWNWGEVLIKDPYPPISNIFGQSLLSNIENSILSLDITNYIQFILSQRFLNENELANIGLKIDLVNTNSIFDIIVFKNNLSSTNNVYVDIFYENN
ncbi:MAG: hypothetical protein CMG48_00025 [Candidatus Marinimicrobia bacterium]|nr:hypothetical protein [Candidatus Neomarinimicrobiota bacterium]